MTTDNGQGAWELSSTQKGLVDNCFEEGQYETAIGTLDQLRASEFKPWPPHLRQLMYISLQSAEELPNKNEFDTSIQSSPSKIVRQQQIRMSMNPIPANVVVNAQRLLMAYLRTSSPGTLSRALPQRRSQSVPFGHHEGDSTVARRSAYITQCQDCWELLRSDFLQQQSAMSSVPKSKTRKRSKQSEKHDLIDSEENPSLPVAENAWPLLDWLITLFERDEDSTIIASRHSRLLSDQLLDNEGKPYLEVPILIIVHCLTQAQLQRQRLAGRFLSLLVNSTTTAELGLNSLINGIYTLIQPPDYLVLLLSQLGYSSNQALKFRIGLCQKIIGGLGLVPVSNVSKPQPRIRQRPTRESDTTDLYKNPQATATEFSIPSTSDILRLFQAPMAEKTFSDTSLTSVWCKFHLLFAYGTLQARAEPNDRDLEWTDALAESVPRVICEVLEQQGPEGSMYQRLLESQVAAWKQTPRTT